MPRPGAKAVQSKAVTTNQDIEPSDEAIDALAIFLHSSVYSTPLFGNPAIDEARINNYRTAAKALLRICSTLEEAVRCHAGNSMSKNGETVRAAVSLAVDPIPF